MSDITVALPAVPDSIPVARHTLDRLADAIEPPLLDNIRLLVSEVVTNSVRHGHSEGIVELRVDVNRRRVRVEVEDHGPGFAAPSLGVTDVPERNSGWGLLLVDRLAQRWGVVTSRTTTVWFEMDRAAGRP